MTDSDLPQRTRLKFGATEIMYLAGVVFLFSGLWIWQGLGIALTVCGAALMGSSLFNDWLKVREELHAAI